MSFTAKELSTIRDFVRAVGIKIGEREKKRMEIDRSIYDTMTEELERLERDNRRKRGRPKAGE